MIPPLWKLTEAEGRALVGRGNPRGWTYTDRALHDQQEWWFGLLARGAVVLVFAFLLFAGLTHKG